MNGQSLIRQPRLAACFLFCIFQTVTDLASPKSSLSIKLPKFAQKKKELPKHPNPNNFTYLFYSINGSPTSVFFSMSIL